MQEKLHSDSQDRSDIFKGRGPCWLWLAPPDADRNSDGQLRREWAEVNPSMTLRRPLAWWACDARTQVGDLVLWAPGGKITAVLETESPAYSREGYLRMNALTRLEKQAVGLVDRFAQAFDSQRTERGREKMVKEHFGPESAYSRLVARTGFFWLRDEFQALESEELWDSVRSLYEELPARMDNADAAWELLEHRFAHEPLLSDFLFYFFSLREIFYALFIDAMRKLSSNAMEYIYGYQDELLGNPDLYSLLEDADEEDAPLEVMQLRKQIDGLIMESLRVLDYVEKDDDDWARLWPREWKFVCAFRTLIHLSEPVPLEALHDAGLVPLGRSGSPVAHELGQPHVTRLLEAMGAEADRSLLRKVLEKGRPGESVRRVEEARIGDYLADHLNEVFEPFGYDLAVYESDDGRSGQNYPCPPVGWADFLALDRKEHRWVLVMVLTIPARDEHIIELLRLIAWVQRMRSGDLPVDGILVAPGAENPVVAALQAVPDRVRLLALEDLRIPETFH